MGFKRRKRRPGRRGLAGMAAAPLRHGVHLTRWSLGVLLGLSVAAVALVLVFWMRLEQGPVRIPGVAELIAQRFNAGSEEIELTVGGLELTLGDASRPTRLEFTDLAVRDADGVPLLSVPRIGARFAMVDLLAGRLQPVAITLDGATARIVRDSDGRIRFGLNDMATGPPGPSGPGPVTRGMDTVTRIVDGFVGDREPVPELARLEQVTIRNADLTYLNAARGRSWHSERADLVLTRTAAGARLEIDLDIAGDPAAGGAGPSLRLTAERRRGTAETAITAGFDNVQPQELAGEVPELGWLAAVEAPLSGRLEAGLGDDGSVRGLSGSLAASGGRVLAVEDDGIGFDRFEVAFSYEPGLRRMRVERLQIAARAAELEMTGFADLATGAGGAVDGLAAQLDIAALRVELPSLFAEAQRFDGGRVVARVDFDSRRIEVAEARLAQGPLRVTVSGQARPGPDGWVTDMRVAGEAIAVDRLVALWPPGAAHGARAWVSENLKGGRVDDVLATLRLGAPGPPLLNLDFRFSDLESTYLKDMTPITRARGRGHLSWDRLDLVVEDGVIESVPGRPVVLAGSTISIDRLFEHAPPGEIAIRGRGPTASVLALLDQPPLGFISKLGLAPGSVGGSAAVSTVLRFPLEKGLKVRDVDVEASATLFDVSMPFATGATGATGRLAVAARRLELDATPERMRIAGAVTADGTPLRLDWEERYGGADQGRDISLSGSVTPAVLADLGLALPGFESGSAPVDLTLRQASRQPMHFDLDADLGPAALTVDPVSWSKPAGRAATLSVEGSLGETVVIDRLALDAPGLAAEGSLQLDAGGRLERARLGRLDMGPLADLTLDVTARGPDAGYDLDIGGRWFDLAFFDDAGRPEPPVVPIDARFAIDQVRLTGSTTLGMVEGTFGRAADGALAADLTGRVGGIAPVAASYRREPGKAGRVHLTADDAGRVLDAAELFSEARGGTLALDAVIRPDAATGLAGTAVIRDVRIRQEAHAVSRVLEEGALSEAAAETRTGSLSFNRVEVPFAVRGDRVSIDTALATSPALAVKLAGTIDQASRAVHLRGVISPAYALTGVLNNIPLIGTLLGGEGEGVLAMTFAVDGTAEKPAISVNPLSLLAPGFLRNIFESDAFATAAPVPKPAPKSAAERIDDAAARTVAPPPTSESERRAADEEQARRLQQLLGAEE